MEPTPLNLIDEALVEFNRIRYRNELAHGIYELMVRRKVTRTRLAELLGVQKSRVSHVLTGERNLQADTLADILLVLGRTPHLVMADDFDEIRFAVDECQARDTSSDGTDDYDMDVSPFPFPRVTTGQLHGEETEIKSSAADCSGPEEITASSSEDKQIRIVKRYRATASQAQA